MIDRRKLVIAGVALLSVTAPWTVSAVLAQPTPSFQGLGDLPGGSFYSEAFGVSADGSTVVGRGLSASGNEAFIWDQVNGMRNLREVLVGDFVLDLTGWRLEIAEGISDDGLTIVGYGDSPNGITEAWMATIPEPATLLLLALGGLLVTSRRR